MIDEKVLIEKLKRTSAFGCIRNAEDKNVFEIINDLAEEYNNGWIPCENGKLPENNHDVYVTYINKMTGDSISSVGWYSQEEKTWFVGHNDTRQKVTAWSPKLPPYKKGE